MTAAQDAMQEMTAQYYNALTAGAGLDPNQFQLAQGAISLGTDSSAIWRMLDSMPPDMVNNFFQTSNLNSFSQSYGAVINNLMPQTGNEQQQILGDDYVTWVAYQVANALTPPTDPSDPKSFIKPRLARFNTWAYSIGLDTSKISAMQTLMGQTDIIANAIDAYNAAKAGAGFAYTASITALTNVLASGVPKSFTLDSKTANSKLNSKWAQADMSAAYWFVSVSASSQWDHTITDMASNGVKTTVSIQKLVTLPGGPYSLATLMSPDLSKYLPWYNSKALQTARAQNDNLLWKHSAPTWDQTFGPKGNMQQATTALIVVDGVQSKTTTTASVAKSDQENFKAQAKLGVWPWFQAEGSGGWKNDVEFNDDGSFTVTSGNPTLGNPVVLGVLVTPIENAFT